ncbi:MAG: UDP-glycosyltransferase, partial [Flavobacteriales bacterium]|nr:UDP-glycosyltransferase [Flavobacteriales bacterium]
NTVLPTMEDNTLLVNTMRHSDLVINVGSSMVFDAVCHNIPCAYIRYNPSREALKKDIYGIYKYIHFQSMPQDAPVLWIDSPEKLKGILLHLETEKATVLPNTVNWFQTINQHPPEKASERIWVGIEKIIN